jgi:hypothetical protein
MPLGLLTDQNQLFLVLENHEKPEVYAQVMQHAAETITVAGVKVMRGGVNAIYPETVR